MNRLLAITATLVGILIIFEGCGQSNHGYKGVPVIFITVDTLRSDHLPAYGYQGVETPHIDAFAEESVLFEHVYAHTPLTLPSHASMMTGMWPPFHGVRDNFGFKVDEAKITLAEHLKAAGYRTGAVVSSMVLRQSTGMEQGFDYYDDQIKRSSRTGIVNFAERLGEDSLELAENWINGQQDASFMMWLHLYDPHAPYTAPPPYDQVTLDYDGEIAYVDALLGRLFETLKSKDFYDQAIIVLTSDHGEGLGEHGEEQHGLLVYRESLQVPLLIKLPAGKRAGTRLKQAAGLADVAPTLCALMGLQAIGDGVDLFAQNSDKRMIYSESLNAKINFGWFQQQSVIRNNQHFIRGDGDKLFDMHVDPKETSDLLPAEPVPSQFVDLLSEIGQGELQQAEISEEDAALLQSLGYVGGFATDESAQDLSETDFLKVFNLVGECNMRLNQGEYATVEKLLSPIVKRFPAMIDARLGLGSALFNQGKYQDAEALHLESLAMSPTNLTAMVALIETKLALKKRAEAEPLVRKAVGSAPLLGARQLLPVLNQYDLFPLAAEIAGDSLQVQSDYAFAEVVLARSAMFQSDFGTAVTNLQRAEEMNSNTPDPFVAAVIQHTYADIAARQGQTQDAVRYFSAALALDPNHQPSRTGLSLLYFSIDEPQLALSNLDEWLQQFPTNTNFTKAAQLCEVVGFTKGAQHYRDQANR